MAMIDDPNNPTGGDWFSQNAPPNAAPSWLPAGAIQNPDGSITLADGRVIPAPPPGYTRDPQTGVVSLTPGATPTPGLNPDGTVNPVWASQPPQGHGDPKTAPLPGPGAPAPTAPPLGVAPPPIDTAAPQLGVPTSGFGSAPPPYMSNPEAPVYQPLPQYRAPEWTGGDYVAPSEAELYASPGYQARLDDRLKGESRRYAAQGTILNGGTLQALDRSSQDYATNEYQTLNANKYDQYKTRYAQFADAAGRDLASRSINAGDANTTFANRLTTYQGGNARTLGDYITNVAGKRNSENDFWSRLMDVNQTGANLAGGSR